MSLIWTEKYRPRRFKEVVGQEQIVDKIKHFVKQKNLPHLLFWGPPGVGKTTLALVIARELYGDEYKSNFLELNASDERGIDIVRNKVKDFARTKAIGKVPFKIIYLDESDALTKEAQQALRRTMENYTSTCRFILSCNYSSKIIDPIQSRCAVFKFRPLPKEHIKEIVKRISEEEGLIVNEEGVEALYEVSGGDLRKAENILQSCASISKEITKDIIYSMAGTAKPEDIKKVLELALSNNFLKARKLLVDIMLNEGLSALDLIKQIQQAVFELNISGEEKVKLIDKCGEIEFRLVEGSDEFIQLDALLAYFTIAKKGNND
jgi:replication factor C small subunit